MSEKVYVTRKKVVLADGSIKEYMSRCKYTTKPKPVAKTAIYKKLLATNNTEKLKKIEAILDEVEQVVE